MLRWRTAVAGLVATSWMGCGATPEPHRVETAKTPTAECGAPTAPRLSCYYLLDDKYAPTSQRDGVVEWQERKLQQMLTAKDHPGVLGRSDGGPGGAQWNPSTDLFCVVVADSFPPPLSVRLNETPVSVTMVTARNACRVAHGFMLPLDTWSKYEAAVPRSALDGPDDLLSNASAIQIDVASSNNLSATGAFYLAHGE